MIQYRQRSAAEGSVRCAREKKKPDLARTYIKDICGLAILVSIFTGLLLYFFGGKVSLLYTDDMVVVGLAVQALTLVAFAQPFQSCRFVFTSALRGAGDSRFTAIITLVGIIIVRPVVSWLIVDWKEQVRQRDVRDMF